MITACIIWLFRAVFLFYKYLGLGIFFCFKYIGLGIFFCFKYIGLGVGLTVRSIWRALWNGEKWLRLLIPGLFFLFGAALFFSGYYSKAFGSGCFAVSVFGFAFFLIIDVVLLICENREQTGISNLTLDRNGAYVNPGWPLDMSDVDRMSGFQFEQWCAELLSRLGFVKITVTPGSGDKGVDILAEKGGLKYAVQCKRYDSKIGLSAIQEVYTGKAVYGCNAAAVMTNQYFTESATNTANDLGIILWDRDFIQGAIRNSGPLVSANTRKSMEGEGSQRQGAHESFSRTCPDCGAPILSEYYYCPCCGAERKQPSRLQQFGQSTEQGTISRQTNQPKKTRNKKSKREKLYVGVCPFCGSLVEVDDDGFCPFCGEVII